MKIKSILIIIFITFALINNVYAFERVLEVSLEIIEDGKATITGIKTDVGFIGNYNSGNYSLILDYGGKTETYKFSPNFYFRIFDKESIHKDIKIPIARETLYLPYNEGLFSIKILNGVETIGFLSVAGLLCNNDRLCQENENFVSCSSDCKSYEKDGICMNIKDGQCDPDCKSSKDFECKDKINTLNLKNNNLKYSGFGLLSLIILYLIYKYLKKKK